MALLLLLILLLLLVPLSLLCRERHLGRQDAPTAGDNVQHQLADVARLEGQPKGQQLKQHAAQGPDVRLERVRLALACLRKESQSKKKD